MLSFIGKRKILRVWFSKMSHPSTFKQLLHQWRHGAKGTQILNREPMLLWLFSLLDYIAPQSASHNCGIRKLATCPILNRENEVNIHRVHMSVTLSRGFESP